MAGVPCPSCKQPIGLTLELIIKRINAQAANIFLIDDKKKFFNV